MAQQDEVSDPSLEEVKAAIKKQRINKSPGADNIQSELLKGSGEIFMERLHGLFLEVWKKEEMPEDWKKGILCPIHKKGDILECKNCRGISLLSTAYKVLSNIIYTPLLHCTETQVDAYQCRFHAGKSTTDNMFVL
jgi:hypothetical protein